MLSVLVWIGMWGQVQPWNNDGDCYIVQAFSERGDGQSSSTPLTVCDSHPPKPAEHVIEIKTVREKREVARTSDIWPGSHEHGKCNKGEGAVNDYFSFLIGVGAVGVTTIQYCERVTSELWIDGVRWGVVKGLE